MKRAQSITRINKSLFQKLRLRDFGWHFLFVHCADAGRNLIVQIYTFPKWIIQLGESQTASDIGWDAVKAC